MRGSITRSIFGVEVRFFERRRAWWWRPLAWVRARRAVGPYGSRVEAVRECAAMLHARPGLRGDRRQLPAVRRVR